MLKCGDRSVSRTATGIALTVQPLRPVLADAGMGGYDAEGASAHLTGFQMTAGIKAGMVLAGLDPSALTHVLITHMHGDHFVGALRRADDGWAPRFGGARVVVTRTEWESSPQHTMLALAIAVTGMLKALRYSSVSRRQTRGSRMSVSPSNIPQTPIMMEAGMKLADGPHQASFWETHEHMVSVVASRPGFHSTIGAPVAGSSWMFFSGKFATPKDMDAWYRDSDHRPVMQEAYRTWFDAFYIRKWRVPADGEELSGPLFLETSIVPEAALSQEKMDEVIGYLREAMPGYGVAPYETLAGEFESQPFQFAGPLAEYPQLVPIRYLLLSHWKAAENVDAWLASPYMARLSDLGEVSHQVYLLLKHQPGERGNLSADGSQRGWVRPRLS